MSRDDISILIFDQHIFFIEKNSIYFFVSISHKENIKKKVKDKAFLIFLGSGMF